MKLCVLLASLFFALPVFADEILCVENVECRTYSDGRSSLTWAPRWAHEQSAEIADLVYLRLVTYKNKNGNAVRVPLDFNDGVWSSEVRSSLFSAPVRSHLKSARNNLQAAIGKCEEVKDSITFNYESCDAYFQRQNRDFQEHGAPVSE